MLDLLSLSALACAKAMAPFSEGEGEILYVLIICSCAMGPLTSPDASD